MQKSKSRHLKSLFLGGLLPVIVFTVIEDRFGTLWGLVAGMVFGLGEVLWEWRTQKKVDTMTWVGNGMILVLGGVSLVTQEGIWFKLQPSILEISTSFFLWGSVVLKKPFILSMLQKQGGLPPQWNTHGVGGEFEVRRVLERSFSGITLRLGVFFTLHAILATWAAFYWSTAAWAVLKGIGLTVSMIVYVVVESLFLRYRLSTIPIKSGS